MTMMMVQDSCEVIETYTRDDYAQQVSGIE